MGKLRTDSTDDFPVESRSGGISYILIHPVITKERPLRDEEGSIVWEDEDNFVSKKENYEERWSHYKATKTEKSDLLDALREFDSYDEVTLLGVWTGKHRTDTHVLELPRFVERLETADL